MITRRFALVLLIGCVAAAAESRKLTALDRYVSAPDPSYQYELIRTTPAAGHTVYLLEMTSQTWRSPAEVDRTVWKHWLTIVKPDRIIHPTAFLFIGGGANRGNAPGDTDAWYKEMATSTNSIVAELRMVPNQPLTFAGESKARTEDTFIAYTWDKYLRGGDDNWPARLPMTKSAVRALDTITAFCASAERGSHKVDRFVVAGGSKRGWTAWTTAAVDSRVIAVAPMVIDMLNVVPSFDHHFRAYGFYSPAVKDYEDMHIMDWAGTARYRELMNIEEPYSYRDRLTMPKLIINAAGDQYFLPDSSQFYFDDLRGEKHLRYVPNTDHSLRNSDVRQTVLAWYDSILQAKPRPRFDWKFEKDGAIRVKVKDKPSEVTLWRATNAEKRDFRLMAIGATYQSTPVTAGSGGLYIAKAPKPEKGWSAYFVELTYPGGKYPMKFTTGVRVTPDTLPHPAPKHSTEPPK